jgi:uncharacterized protein (TIGR03435 family)
MKLACLAALAAAIGLAQPALEFEAASVKLQTPVAIDPMNPATISAAMQRLKGGPDTSTPGRIHYSNVSLKALIMKAYDLYADQIAGPDRLAQDRYAIDAIVPEGATAGQFQQMLQTLLAKRFQLAFEWEERDFKVYRLRVAKDGPKLKFSTVTEAGEDDDPLYPTAAAAQAKQDSRGCLLLPTTRKVGAGRNGCMTYVGWSIPDLTMNLGMMVAWETGTNYGPKGGWAHILDETGLTGRFDFTLQYDTTYYSMLNAPNIPANLRPSAPKSDSIFKAVESQLGLKLEPMTARLKAMVIRRVERIPTED